jgi:TolA-binding protein
MSFYLNVLLQELKHAKMYEDAVDYFLKAQRKFPDSKNAPIYLHNRARILG